MNKHENLQFRESAIQPTIHMLEQALGSSYTAYKALQEALPSLEIVQQWQWYTPYKAWFAKGQHSWVTPRGTEKVKTLYWLHVYEGHFDVAVWFKEKNRAEILNADVSKETIKLITSAETMGKLPTFPVVFDIATPELLADIYTLIEYKKKLEK